VSAGFVIAPARMFLPVATAQKVVEG
jgi:hypothetical protein